MQSGKVLSEMGQLVLASILNGARVHITACRFRRIVAKKQPETVDRTAAGPITDQYLTQKYD